MRTKRVVTDPEFPTGEASVQPLLRTRFGKTDASRVTKHASEALDYIRVYVPEPGKTAMLVLALGAEETYGANRNGDGFPEFPVVPRDVKHAAEAWIGPDEVLPRHYDSFERGHVFKHHVNRDPARASGTVKRAFWNPRMHRVELVISVDNAKDPEWVARVSDGEFPAVSMGCRIKWDVCAICGNRAPTRAAYCTHARDHLGEVLPDGRRCSVHNPSPDFFDISRVFRPADRTGYTLLKAASVEYAGYAAIRNARSASLRKVSDIDKVIRGETVAAQVPPAVASTLARFRDASMRETGRCDDAVSDLAADGIREVLAAFRIAGAHPTARDFLVASLRKAGAYHVMSDDLASTLEDLQPQVSAALADNPDVCDELTHSGILIPTDGRSVGVREAAARIRNKRANLIPEEVWGREERPRTQLLTAQSSRGPVQTTLGDAMRAGPVLDGSSIDELVGASGILSSAYRAALSRPGAWGMPVRSEEGLLLPHSTEFSERQGSWALLAATSDGRRRVRVAELRLDECATFTEASRVVGSYVRAHLARC